MRNIVKWNKRFLAFNPQNRNEGILEHTVYALQDYEYDK